LVEIDSDILGFAAFVAAGSLALGLVRIRRRWLKESTRFDLGTPGGLLEPLNFVPEFLDLLILFGNDRDQGQDERCLLGDGDLEALDLDGFSRFGRVFVAHSQ
jgi:hypothetical protein